MPARDWLLGLLIAATLTTTTPHVFGSSWKQWRNTLKPQGKPAGELTLAVDGKTDYVIVIPHRPTTQEQKAGEELAHWLKEMTGASFPILGDDQPPRDHEISLGRTKRLAAAGVGVPQQKLAPEGYRVAVAGSKLFLMGDARRGPLYAVFHLLEEDLGCRWYTPGASRIPQRPTLKFRPVPRTDIPPVKSRSTRHESSQDPLWSLRNGVSGQYARIRDEWGGTFYVHGGGHSFFYRVPPSDYFKEHPEYYAQVNGVRRPTQLCLTNPEVARVAAQSVIHFVRQHPEAEMISVSQQDGAGFCRCPNCSALDRAERSHGGSRMLFVNRVAALVEKQYPQVKIVTLAYSWTAPPPKTLRPRKNVIIWFATDTCMWQRPFTSIKDDAGPVPTDGVWATYWDVVDHPQQLTCRKMFLRWTRIHDQIHIWDYPVNYSHHLAPMPNMDIIASNIRFFAEHGAEGIMEEAPVTRGTERGRMRAWVYAKLMWDPSRDHRELMDDFIWGYYGKAAPAIAEYNDLLRAYAKKYDVAGSIRAIRYPMDSQFLLHGFVDKAKAIFDRAERLADTEETLRRVQMDRLPIMYVELAQLHQRLTKTDLPVDKAYFAALLDRFEKMLAQQRVTVLQSRVKFADWIRELREAIAKSGN